MQQTANPAPGFARHPDKRITVESHGGTVIVKAGDVVIAASSNARILKEDGCPPVFYLPFEDIRFATLERTNSRTHCPFKGDASYWRLAAVGESQDVMWAYEAPFDEMLSIKDHGAFYGDRVEIETVS